jgi:hypothetical protein
MRDGDGFDFERSHCFESLIMPTLAMPAAESVGRYLFQNGPMPPTFRERRAKNGAPVDLVMPGRSNLILIGLVFCSHTPRQ